MSEDEWRFVTRLIETAPREHLAVFASDFTRRPLTPPMRDALRAFMLRAPAEQRRRVMEGELLRGMPAPDVAELLRGTPSCVSAGLKGAVSGR
jgi:hypothetical protein